MTSFAIAATALTLLAMLVVVFGPRLQRRGTKVSRADCNVDVLRQQLVELERECAAGLLTDREFGRARDELQRRLLADLAISPMATMRSGRSPGITLVAVACLLPVAAAVLYFRFGAPRLLDAPTASPALVVANAAADASPEMLLAQLEAQVAATPKDGRAWVMLARSRMQLDQFELAANAYARALEVSDRVARDPQVWCEYADALGMAQGGRLAGRPLQFIDKALALDALHPRALEMAGSAAVEARDYRGALAYWRRLETRLPEGSMQRTQIGQAVVRLERLAVFALPSGN